MMLHISTPLTFFGVGKLKIKLLKLKPTILLI